MAIKSFRAPIVVTHEGGLTFAAQVGSHRIVTDQPIRSGGDDRGPSPVELLGASLGSCIALYVQQFCQVRGLPYEGLRVEVEQSGAANPNRVGRFVARVILAYELPEQYTAMLERVAQSCPAHNTLTLGADVSVVVSQLEPA